MKDNFILRQIAGESLLIPVGEAALAVNGLIALSESAALLYERLREDCSRQELIDVLLAEYEVSEETAGEDVDAFLVQMRRLDMLDEEPARG